VHPMSQVMIRGGFWAALSGWFFPDDDRHLYAEGLRRGGFLISVEVDDATHDTAHDILDDEGSIDIDERADTSGVWKGGSRADLTKSWFNASTTTTNSRHLRPALATVRIIAEADDVVRRAATPSIKRTSGID
jgi:hypothetical protein